MFNNKKYKKTLILNVIGGLLVILIAFYIMIFKKDEINHTGYVVSLCVLFPIGGLTILFNIILYRYVKKNFMK